MATASRIHDPQRIGLNEITDVLLRRADESLGSYLARTGIKDRRPTERTVDYLMAHFQLPPELRDRIRNLAGNLMGRLPSGN